MVYISLRVSLKYLQDGFNFTTPFLEKKSSTKDVDEGTDELADIPLLEKVSSTKDVDKGTYEWSDMKKAVVIIRRNGLYQFEGQSKVSTGWF